MKITFEDNTLSGIIIQMVHFLSDTSSSKATSEGLRQAVLDQAAKTQGPGPEVFAQAKAAVNKPVDKPVDKPADKSLDKPERTEKQKANDERLRERALAKNAAGLKPFDKMPDPAVVEKYAKKLADKAAATPKTTAGARVLAEAEAEAEAEVEAEMPNPEPFADPVEVVNIRNKTITDLQEAYANGHQQEVFELLSRFGNGAKSFRELPPEAFMPIREAIDKGALT